MWQLDHGRLAAISRGKMPLSLVLVLLLTIFTPATEAQGSPPSSPSDSNYWGNNTYSFNPSVAILIIVLISAFFFLGFFSVYIRNCGGNYGSGTGASVRGALANAMARSRRQRGLEADVLETFPTMIYSEVKKHKVGKGSLECAVCLSEFEDEENIRLLPKCSHVFHTDCIDEWLSSHVTCPVCRCNLTPDPNQASDPTEEGVESSASVTVEEARNPSNRLDSVVVVDVEEPDDESKRQEAIELERIGTQRRALRAKSVRQQPKFPRSHSTGHSLAAPPATVRPEGSVDKHTLILPDHIRKEIIASGQLKRARSLHSFPTQGEPSSRRGYRASGEGSTRLGRSIRFGRSDRWPSFITRTFSTRAPAWVSGRRGETEGSVKKPDGEGSNKGKQGSNAKGPFDCLGGVSGSKVGAAGEEEDETMAMARRV